ncbi:S8 family serine peptidase [Synechococcus sp. MIT S9503]|uniref:S8 family serine peptidase n=1 Tax=Synechococcus sp. MIT S9503 TaxID=3082547 RepID=UPI0039A446C2
MNHWLDLLKQPWQGRRILHVLDQLEANKSQRWISEAKEGFSSNQYFVFFEGNDKNNALSDRIETTLRKAGINAKPTQFYDAINGFLIELNPSEAKELLQSPFIKSVEADRPMPMTPPVEIKLEQTRDSLNESFSTSDQLLKSYKTRLAQDVSLDQFWIDAQGQQIEQQLTDRNVGSISSLPIYNNGTASSGEILPYGVKAVWAGQDISAQGNAGNGTYAFVIDSGVLNTTGDLNINTAWSKSWINGESAFSDGSGHGTHVAGTIAALANGIGVVGVAPGAEIISLKVFDSSGGGASYSSIISAINHAVNVINSNGLDKSKTVINMSLGGGFSSGLDTAVKNAADQGIQFAIAAGNSGSDADYYSPASAGDHSNVYTVSAVDDQYLMSSWSNWDDSIGGDDVDVAAPGVNILSYYQGGDLAYLSGTSMAAPHVAGLLLMGGVKEGDMVQANSAGQSDPFALASASQPPTPPPAPINPPTEAFDDDFNGGQVESFWSSIRNGSVNSNFFGRIDSLFFTGSGKRSATTKAIDLDHGGTISFDLIYGTDFNGGEEVDPGEEVVLEYSNNGSSWKKLQTYVIGNSTRSWGSHTTILSEEVATNSTQLRWRQKTHSNRNWDQWAIDNVNIKVAPLTSYSEVAGKYYYGNGDYYFFTGTISSQYGGGSFAVGQKIYATDSQEDSFDQIINETGNQGYYLITSASNKTGNADSSILIGDYYDSETRVTVIPHATTSGTEGLGSESAYLTSRQTQSNDLINNYNEADAPSFYWEISGKYFYGNGDFYSFTGFVNDEHTDGKLLAGEKIDADKDLKDSFSTSHNELGISGYYELDSVQRNRGSSSTGLKIISYYDSETLFNVRPASISYGFQGLGSESGWLSSAKYGRKDYFDHASIADIQIYENQNTAGDVAFQKDSGTGLYAVSVNGGDSIAITWNGKQIHEGIYSDWQTLAAANINGTNTVLWKNTRGNYLHTWSLDNNWQRFSGQGEIALNSSDALSLETDFNIDLNGNNHIGANYSTINTAGEVAFQQDSGTGLYAVSVNGSEPTAITWNGKEIHEGIYSGWQTLAAANINGTNTVLWKNTRGNYLHTWSLDNNWQRVSGQGEIALNSSDALSLETDFNIDLNGNNYIGANYSTINTAGEVAFQQDSVTGLYAVSVNGSDSTAITWNGKQIHEGIYSGWKTLAAANINGTNTVLWKNTRGNYLHTWSLDNNWRRVSGQGKIAVNSAAALSLETDFNIDLNGNNHIGANYSTINTAGEVAFQQDSVTGLYAVSVNGGDSIAITWNGKQIHEGIYSGWQTLAAANINGTNTVLWKNTSGNYLHTWSLDNNWQRFSGQGEIALNSSAALSLETDFNIDLNGDNQINFI